MGIRTKLISSLAAILVVLTLLLGTGFAIREQRRIVDLKRDHLRHSAELAASLLEQTAPADRERAIDTWNRASGGSPSFSVMFRGDHEGTSSAFADPGGRASELMSVEVPIPSASGDEPSKLVATEPMPDTQALLLANLSEHFALGAFLTAAAMLAIAIVCQRLVVRPVRWLVNAADAMAQDDDWEPVYPENRRSDEIGVLGDHIAELSRRLASAVRSARHGSAHLVAVRVRRELEDPIRRLTVGLVTLEAASESDPDAKREIQQMYNELRLLNEISRRLGDVSPEPGLEISQARCA
jgi:methyl-accepting chemotaxis protein